jgi:two-component system CheB/CheR fusion protein
MEEQHRASTEEMKAGHEELQAMNEELRSAGEELVTSREELQSVNEELQTVNHEMSNRVEELSDANSDLQNLMGATNIATIFLDRELRIKRYTPPAMALFNFLPADLGRPLSHLTHRLDYPAIDTDAALVLETLASVEKEVRAGDRWFLARMQPYRTLDDRIAGIVFTFVDITERRNAVAERMRTEERLRRILENIRDHAIFSMDLDRKITSWHSGAEKVLGYSEAEIIGQPGDVFFTAEDRAAGIPEQEAATALAEGRASDERWHVRKDGSRFWCSGIMSAMRNSQDETLGLVKIMRDSTGERQFMEEITKARADAEAAARAKDRFLAVLSHELRTPLTPVLLSISALQDEPDLSPEMREDLAIIRRNIELETALIDDLLDVNRISTGKLAIREDLVSVHQAVQDGIQICAGDLKAKGIHVDVDLSAEHDGVRGDPVRLRQVAWNLLRNARQYTPAGGNIRVHSRNMDHSILIEVTDNGDGIGADFLPQIFEPFNQGGAERIKKTGGLGLGLAISRAIVTAHGGEISALSDGPGKGACFRIVLPLAK